MSKFTKLCTLNMYSSNVGSLPLMSVVLGWMFIFKNERMTHWKAKGKLCVYGDCLFTYRHCYRMISTKPIAWCIKLSITWSYSLCSILIPHFLFHSTLQIVFCPSLTLGLESPSHLCILSVLPFTISNSLIYPHYPGLSVSLISRTRIQWLITNSFMWPQWL